MTATSQGSRPFDSIYRHGFARVVVAVPEVALADPATNAERALDFLRRADQQRAALVVFPELNLTGYSLEDLFLQQALLDEAESALEHVVEESKTLCPLLLVGLPLRIEDGLFNCAVAVHRGRILGVVPKTYLPNYREYYEKRQFRAAEALVSREIQLAGQRVPLDRHLLFSASDLRDFVVGVEICEDLWAPIPPSTFAALAGATVLCNLSASNVTIDKAKYRNLLCQAQSGRAVAAYAYSGTGYGESTTDLAWDGHAMIAENGDMVEESQRFGLRGCQLVTDVDLDRLAAERMRLSSFSDCAREHRETVSRFRTVEFELEIDEAVPLQREISRFPYVPIGAEELDERCHEAYNIQVQGLVRRLEAANIERLVVGISGGLDSTQALLVATRAFDLLERPRTDILAYTMPGFATSDRTLRNAHALMGALGVNAEEIDIRPSCRQMLADLDHPFARGEDVYDVTFENVQAGERTSHLFRLANHHSGMVLGTGDLSELALGWATYGVGDHMSHYNVNGSVPKTLIQHLIRWQIHSSEGTPEAADVLRDILDTEISPELVPGDDEGAALQSTEAKIGPYELQDFNLFYLTRYGYRPSKVAFLARAAWSDKSLGAWPSQMSQAKRNEYDLPEIKKWLEVFLFRFFAISQFKRSAVPNGPKVGSGGSLSPRGDWRAPSDSTAEVWLRELRENVP